MDVVSVKRVASDLVEASPPPQKKARLSGSLCLPHYIGFILACPYLTLTDVLSLRLTCQEMTVILKKHAVVSCRHQIAYRHLLALTKVGRVHYAEVKLYSEADRLKLMANRELTDCLVHLQVTCAYDLRDWSWLSVFTALQYVALHKVNQLRNFAASPTLTTVIFTGSPYLHDVSMVASCPRLNYLGIWKTDVSNLEAFVNHKTLKWVDARECDTAIRESAGKLPKRMFCIL
jgi:hypothetical protein